MRLETIQKLCCPFDKGALELTTITTDLDSNVLEGFFCCHECQRVYPIVKGIPIMSPDEYREFQLELPMMQQWEKYLKGKAFNNFMLKEPETKALS